MFSSMRIIILLIALFLIPATRHFAHAENILILNSYHLGYKWSDDIIDGIRSVMEKRKNTLLFTEFMDTKRIFDDKTFFRIVRYLQEKYCDTQFDLIITSDDNAFNFIKSFRKKLFPGVPVVFCGVNYFKKSELTGMKNITGINESADFQETLQLIFKLHPNTNLIIFICDQTPTGNKIFQEINSLIPSLPSRIKTMVLNDIKMTDLLNKIERLPKDSIIYFTTFFQDNTKTFYEYHESIALIAEHAQVPIYGAWDIHLGHGIVGGKLTCGYFQGEAAAILGTRILEGEPADTIPMIEKSPNRYMFDMDQLQRFHIRVTQLPESSKIIHPTIHFNHIFIMTVLGIGFLSFVILFLIVSNIKRKIAEKKLKVTLDHLEQRVIDRTEEVTLTNDRLNQELEERNRTERALKHSHHFLETLIDNLPVAVFTKDAKTGTFTLWNKQCERLYGLTADQVLGKNDYDFFPKEQADTFKKNDHITFNKRTRIDIFEEKINTYGQGQKIVHTIKTPIFDEDNMPLQLLCISEDITKRKKAEEELRKHQEFLRNVIDTDPNFIFVKDRDDKFVLANQAMADLCGTSVEDMVGKKVSAFNPNQDEVNQYFVDNEEVMSSLQPKFIPEQRFTTPSGKAHYIQIIKKPLISEDGTADKILCVATDITDRKRTEKELESARMAAESSNLAKSEFLANMSHDLRTPLHGILGFTQILQRNEALMTEIGSAVDTIHRSGEHLLMMINDVLDLSKIEAQKLDLREAEIYLPGFLQTIVEIIRVRASQHHISFVFHIDNNIPKGILGDETRLRQILLNLLGNAVKFTQKGEVRFTVRQSDHTIHFMIEDTGIGIPQDKIQEIFLPFHQVANNHIQTEGTGLGLAICNKLLKLMHSELNVSSELGKGSTFDFYLPFKEIVISSDIITPNNQKIIGYAGRNIKILVCDDRKTNRDVLSQLLTDIGFDVVEASDGRDCLEKALAHHPDIILMDLMMPEMDGYESTRALRNMPEIKDTVVIAVSAGVFNKTREECLAAGCNDFIPKPVITDELLEKIGKYLSLKWQYDKKQSANATNSLNQKMIPPPDHVLAQYKTLVMAGRITEIQRQLKKLVQNDSQYIPFAEKIRQLAYEFRNDDIQTFIDQFLSKGDINET